MAGLQALNFGSRYGELTSFCWCSSRCSSSAPLFRMHASLRGLRFQEAFPTTSPKGFLSHKMVPHSFYACIAEATGETAFQLRETQTRFFHQLPSGLKMEVIQQSVNSDSSRSVSGRPPLVFLHGSYHAAWCWGVHWLPFFVSQGYHCFALSFLGQGESDVPASGVGGTLQSHARDVAHFIQHKLSMPPVLVGHSFGGLIVQHYLAHLAWESKSPLPVSEGWEEPYPPLAAAILACSVPPTGNGPLVQRYLLNRPIASIKVTLSFAAKLFAYSKSLCQETFFSPDMPLSLVHEYQKQLKRSSKVPLFNLRQLNGSLPVGCPVEHAPPVLVLGGGNDFVVDLQGLHDTAVIYGNDLVVLPSIAHDVMLDTAWKNAAEVVNSWLKQKVLLSAQ